MHSVKTAAEHLRTHLAVDDYATFYKTWAREHTALWRLLSTAHLRADFSYSDTDPYLDSFSYYDADPRFDDGIAGPLEMVGRGEINLDEARSLYELHLIIEDDTRLRFPFSDAPVAQDEKVPLQPFAERTARALELPQPSDLDQLVRFLLSYPDRFQEPLHRLQDIVQNELVAQTRLIVRGLISNAGNSPFSVANQGTVFVSTAHVPYTEAKSGNGERYPEDLQIRLLFGDAEKAYEYPVPVRRDELYRFTAISAKKVRDFDPHGVLLTAFREGERSSYLGILTFFPYGQQVRSQYTERFIFRDWQATDLGPQA